MLLEVNLSKISKENIRCKDHGPKIYFTLKKNIGELNFFYVLTQILTFHKSNKSHPFTF